MLGAHNGSSGPTPRVRDLHYDIARDDVSVYRPDAEFDPFAAIKQIKTPGILVDIDSDDPGDPDATAYQIRFYYRDQFTAEEWSSEEVPINEAFTAPFVYWEVAGQSGPHFLTLWKKRHTPDTSVTLARYEYTSNNVQSREITLTTSVPDGSGGWTPLRVETESWAGTTRTYVRKDAPDIGTIAEQVVEQYSPVQGNSARFPSLLRREVAIGGGDPLVTQFAYFNATEDGPQHDGKYGYLKWVTLPDGSWESYDYVPGDERPTMISRPRPDGGVVPGYPDPAFHQTTLVEYAFGVDIEPRPTSVTETIPDSGGGYSIVAKRFFEYGGGSGPPTRDVEVAVEPSATAGSSTNLLTVITYDSPENPLRFAERVSHVNFGDGRSIDYEWEAGEFQIDENMPPTPSFVPGSGGQARRVTVTEEIAPFGIPVAGKSRRSAIVLDRVGRIVWQQEFACTGEDTFTLMDSLVRRFDELPVDVDPSETVYHNDGTVSTVQHDLCQCGSATVTDRAGASTSSEYDAIGRLIAQTQFDGPQGNIVTTYAYGTASGLRSVTAVTTGGSDTVRTRTEYDLAGRVRFVRQGPVGAELVTEYQYSPGGTLVTVIDPGGATSVTDHYRDGRIKSVTGTGVVEQHYEYSAASGEQTTTVISGPTNVGAGELRYVATTTDMAGRTKRVERPGFSADPQSPVTLRTEYEYFGPEAGKPHGALKRVTTSAGGTPLTAPTLYDYDELARVIRSGLDINGDGMLNLAGSDRIVAGETQFVQLNGMWWTQTTQSVYRTAGAADVTSVVARSVFPAWLPETPAVHGWSEAVDANGNVVTTKTVIDAAQKLVTTTTEYPHISGDDVSVSYNGRLVETSGHTGIATSYGHDGLGRVDSITEPRTGLATTRTHDGYGRVASMTDPAGVVTQFTYYDPAATPGAGRLKVVEVLNTPAGSATRFEYDLLGHTIRTWGDVPNPAWVEFDAYGQPFKLHTFRAGTGFEGTTWPGGVGDGDVTTWAIDSATGLARSKTDALSHATAFLFTPDGRLSRRTWARLANGDPLTTDYAYDADSGQLTGVDYSTNASAADLSFMYYRHGGLFQVTDAAGTRQFGYTDALDLSYEQLPSYLGEATLTRLRDDSNAPGRYTGLSIDPVYLSRYEYEAATGRLSRVTGPGLPETGTVYGAYYTYASAVTGSDLVSRIDFKNDNVSKAATIRQYELALNIIDTIENKWDPDGTPATISKYDYASDMLRRRSGVSSTGSAFPSNQSLALEYDTRNQLTTTDRTVGSTTTTDWRQYEYDPIGSFERSRAKPNGWTNYFTSATNAYDRAQALGTGQPSNPAYGLFFEYDADGNMSTSALAGDLNCDGNVDSFDIDPFTLALSDPQAYAQQYPNCDILQADINGDGSVNGFDADAFTNMMYGSSGDGLTLLHRVYVWDGENRLIRVEPAALAGGGAPVDGDRKVEFAYDYLSRRIEKRESEWDETLNGGVGDWVTVAAARYVYDGWNVVLELDARDLTGAAGGGPDGSPDNAIVRKFTWGLDLAGLNGVAQPPSAVNLQSAGGVGGLLAVEQLPYTAGGSGGGGGSPVLAGDYVYLYDGNGNVGQLIDLTASDAPTAIVARYEYDPFGNLVGPDDDADGTVTAEEAGAYATMNSYRFSTKPFDAETGLYSYIFRYYSPRLGRWMNRDPIGEWDGVNVYGFVGSDPTNLVDALGLFDDSVDDYMKRMMRAVDRENQSGLCTQGDNVDALKRRGCEEILRYTLGEGYVPVFDEGPEQDAVLVGAEAVLVVDSVATGVALVRYAVVKGGRIVAWLRRLPSCSELPVIRATCSGSEVVVEAGTGAERSVTVVGSGTRPARALSKHSPHAGGPGSSLLERISSGTDPCCDARGRIVRRLNATERGRLRTEARKLWERYSGSSASTRDLDVHHRIPLEWSHLFPTLDPNRTTNLVGIHSSHHRANVNNAWRTWKAVLGRDPSAAEVLEQACRVDRELGSAFVTFPH
ncbi:MAG: hypothetical protein CHACPFDD_01250 [Phycisphaerae bacterium]|nr:hypothetical protein [Phycisphaerae bacterium]